MQTPLLALTTAQDARSRRHQHVPILCAALSVAAEFGGWLTIVPEVRLLEMTICRDYYRIHDPSAIGPSPNEYIKEELCKLDEIQQSLAYLRAWKDAVTTFAGAPSMSSVVSFFLAPIPSLIVRAQTGTDGSRPVVRFSFGRRGRPVQSKASFNLGHDRTRLGLPVAAHGL